MWYVEEKSPDLIVFLSYAAIPVLRNSVVGIKYGSTVIGWNCSRAAHACGLHHVCDRIIAQCLLDRKDWSAFTYNCSKTSAGLPGVTDTDCLHNTGLSNVNVVVVIS